MITKIRIKNFRQISDQTIELKQSVVIVGPNNGGKTTFLQAISLFSIALRAWGAEHVNKKSKAFKRTGVAINIEEIINIPISEFKELWTDLNVRSGEKNQEGKPITKNIRIEIHAEGHTNDQKWKTGFEFDYGRDSLIYVRLTNDEQGDAYDFPEILMDEKIGYLPSVTGLKPVEDKLEIGSILRHIGNGNTSDVLRNICFLLYEQEDKSKWGEFVAQIEELFKITLNPPQYIPLTGLLKMTYNEGSKKQVDLASIGSGTKQAILLFAYILAFPNTVNLLDEPDAHLEVIRQQNIYDKISNIAKKNNSQVIIASHSESVLNRAFGKDFVISSVFGKFEIVNHSTYVKSILRDYGYEQLIIAKQRPRIFYFEGVTDLDFIKAFAAKLDKKDLIQLIDNDVYPFPVNGNDRARMNNHFSTLKKFIPELKAFALFDRIEKKECAPQEDLLIKEWTRNEIENYIPLPQTLNTYIDSLNLSLFTTTFKEIIRNNTPPAAYKDLNDNFWKNTKISDNFLIPIFEKAFDEASLPRNKMEKSKFYQLVEYIDPELLDNEVVHTLDAMLNHLK
jgi:AAA15 family ATPase/GTPase